MPKRPEVEKLWEKLFTQVYNVDDREWDKQGPRLREISRLAMALAHTCEELSSDCSKEEKSVQKQNKCGKVSL